MMISAHKKIQGQLKTSNLYDNDDMSCLIGKYTLHIAFNDGYIYLMDSFISDKI